MKKVILAVFVSGVIFSASTAKNTFITGTYSVNDSDTVKKIMITEAYAPVSDTDTTKKVMMTDIVAMNDDIISNTTIAVRDTDTTKKIMTEAAFSEDSKTQIDPAALPDAVKTTLKGDEYKDWQVTNAYEVKGASAYYEIELKKGDNSNTVKLDKDGKKI